MKTPDKNDRPRFYFALPRLIASQFGGNAARTERNWLEATLVGGLSHLLWYLFAVELLLVRLPLWEKIALLIPVAFLVWISWLIALYVNSLLIRLLRACGFFCELPNARLQSVLLGILTTAFACHLVAHASWFSSLGWLWVAAITCNLLAAAVFVIRDALEPNP